MSTVLVVDDDVDIRTMLARTLQREGFKVILTCNGREALDYLHTAKEQPFLVLSDVSMPMMTGPELLEAMRAEGIELPVILQSGYRDPKVGGGYQFLKKPYSIDKLLGLIRPHF